MVDGAKALAIGALTLCVNIVLAVVKIVTGLVGNSYALVADGIESASDIFSSLIVWAGFRLSLRPPDETHPYGHGKIESLAGLFSGGALLAAAAVIAWNSVAEIRSPHYGPAWFTLPVLIAVVIVKMLLSRKIRSLGESLDSRALEGDAWHHLSDAITSGAAAIGIAIALIGGPGWEAADDYAALLACVIIVINGIGIMKRSLHEVLDGNVSRDVDARMRTLALEVPGVVDIEKCRVRKSGVGLFVELHVLVDGETSVHNGHRIGHDVKDHIRARNPQVLDVIVHLEPSTCPVPHA
jgi:cation diffusion facilitator family transporter